VISEELARKDIWTNPVFKMSNSTLYDDDILLWSEQQAAVIRDLARTRRVPNELDIENVAEEIETVGRSELAAVESYLQLILLHLMKSVLEPEAESMRHWQSEISGFHSNLKRRYSPSMRKRIDLQAVWGAAREQAILAHAGTEKLPESLPERTAFGLDELLADRLQIENLRARLREIANSRGDRSAKPA